MKLVDKDAGIINYNQYKKWRNTGIAFELRDANYNIPNKTLASGLLIKHEGDQYLRRGYWGDIVTGPYVAAFGIECDDKTFFKKQNNVYYKTAQDVASWNVVALLHEMVEHNKYKKHDDKKKDGRPKKNEEDDHCIKKEGQAVLWEIKGDDEIGDTQCKDSDIEFCTKQKVQETDEKKDISVSVGDDDLAIRDAETKQVQDHQAQNNIVENQFVKHPELVKQDASMVSVELIDNGSPPAQKLVESIGDSLKKKEWLHARDIAELQNESVGGHGDQRQKAAKHISEPSDEKVPMTIAKDIAKDCHIYFLSSKFLLDMHQRERFLHLFNLVFYANSMVHVLKPEMKEILAPNAVLLLETAKFLIDLRKEQVTEFVGKLVSIASSMGCKAAIPCDPKLDTVARFYYELKEN